MKIQKEIVLRKEALALIVEKYLQRQSRDVEVKVRFAGFEVNRKQLTTDLDKATRFVLVVDESPITDQDDYSPYSDSELPATEISTPKSNRKKEANAS